MQFRWKVGMRGVRSKKARGMSWSWFQAKVAKERFRSLLGTLHLFALAHVCQTPKAYQRRSLVGQAAKKALDICTVSKISQHLRSENEEKNDYLIFAKIISSITQ